MARIPYTPTCYYNVILQSYSPSAMDTPDEPPTLGQQAKMTVFPSHADFFTNAVNLAHHTCHTLLANRVHLNMDTATFSNQCTHTS